MISLTKAQFRELEQRLLHPNIPEPIDNGIKVERVGCDIVAEIPLDLSFIENV